MCFGVFSWAAYQMEINLNKKKMKINLFVEIFFCSFVEVVLCLRTFQSIASWCWICVRFPCNRPFRGCAISLQSTDHLPWTQRPLGDAHPPASGTVVFFPTARHSTPPFHGCLPCPSPVRTFRIGARARAPATGVGVAAVRVLLAIQSDSSKSAAFVTTLYN